MPCIKTGAQILLEEYGQYVVGDIHQFGETTVIRVSTDEPAFKPVRDALHYKVSRIDQWWNDLPYGTLVVKQGEHIIPALAVQVE